MWINALNVFGSVKKSEIMDVLSPVGELCHKVLREFVRKLCYVYKGEDWKAYTIPVPQTPFRESHAVISGSSNDTEKQECACDKPAVNYLNGDMCALSPRNVFMEVSDSYCIALLFTCTLTHRSILVNEPKHQRFCWSLHAAFIIKLRDSHCCTKCFPFER
jgi:hypothetical protein